MRYLLFIIYSCLNVIQLSVAASITTATWPWKQPRSATVVLKPSEDEFYTATGNLDNVKPGAILRHRIAPSPIAAFGITPDNLERTHQLLYKTSDGKGRNVATVLTVLVPKKPNFNAMLSFQDAEDAVIIDCAPSYGMLLASESDPKLNSATAQLQVLLIQAALADGWVVVVPDFQGPRASALDSTLAGQAVLDGIRAGLMSSDITGIHPNATVALWGYSGGASVTKYATELQPLYAAELTLSGAAIGGITATSGTADLDQINRGPHSGLLPGALIAVAQDDAVFKGYLDLNLKPQFKAKFYSPLHQCLDANLATFLNDDIFAMFYCWHFCVVPALLTALSKYIVKPQTKTPTAPMFWYQSTHDEIANISQIDQLVQKYCESGAKVHYLRNTAPSVNHRNYGIIGAPQALAWLRGLINNINGTAPEETKCVTESVDQPHVPQSFLDVFPPIIQKGLLTLLNQPASAV